MRNVKYLLLALLISVAGIARAQTEQTLSLAEVATKTSSPNAQILDARTAEEFAQNHLKGAINISSSSATYQEDLKALSKVKPTFIYSIANGRSAALAKELRSKGFNDVNVIPGGIANWIGSGYPIVNNSKKGVALSLAQFSTLTGASDFVLVDFGSKYCGGCRKLIPVLDSLENKQGFGAKIVRIEAYDNAELIKHFKVNQLPTLVLYQNKKVVWKKSGLSSTAEIAKVVDTHKHKREVAQTL